MNKRYGYQNKENEIHNAKRAIANILYQSLLDEQSCYTQHHDMRYKECSETKRRLSDEMSLFISEYIHLEGDGVNIISCEAKSRLLGMETMYPPYSFLIIDGRKPVAYDAKVFLECVRK